MTPTKKAGCFLLNKKTKTVCLIWREKHQDCSFPKGHVEPGESYVEAAVRETDEETGRRADLIASEEARVFSYTTPKGEAVEAFYFFAYDAGASDNVYAENLVHEPIWVPVNQVVDKLTHDNLRAFWLSVCDRAVALLTN